MNVLKTCLSCALILIGSSALPVQKEVISTRLVTRWELEFVSLKLTAAASKLPCQESGTLPEIPSLSLVTRYEIPKRPMGTMRLSVNQPKMDCENGLISLYNGLSPSLMTISAISDQTCLSEAALRLYINIGAKEESTSSAVFHTTVYPEQTTIEWKEKFLLDDTGNSILRLKWRVSCGHYTPDNHQRLKRQIPDSSDNGDNATDTNSTTIILNPVPGNNDTLNSPALSAVDNSTDGVGNNSQTDTDALGSGEPTESFVTGIRKTSEPFKEVSNLLNLPSSTPTDPLATAPSVSPVPPVINPGNHREDNLVKQTTEKINAPAAGDGENTDPLNKLPDVKTEDLGSTQTTTPSTTPKPTGRTRPGDRKDPSSTTTTATTATTATAKPSSSVKPSIPSTTTKSTRRTRPGDKENPKTITPSISTTTKQPNRPANGDGTTASTSTSAPASTPTSPGDKEDTKSTPKPTTSTRPPHRTRPGDKPLETLAVKPTTTTAAPARTRPTDRTLTQAPTKSPSTSPPRRTRPGDKPLETPAVKPTTTTTTAAPAGTRPTDRPLTPPITKKDVIFTAPKPSPTYPDTSNEPYIGKTGETSSAGRVDKGPNLVTDDATDEATVWPIVMGLVVGIPTIIVISIAITVVHKKVGQPKRTMSSPGGYFERKPPQVPFVTYKAPSRRTYSIEGPPTDIEV